MASVNKVILVGNLGRDPETKYMPDGAAITNVSIGSLTSQHFANFYLGWFDRFVKETLRVRGYVRYMDDSAMWAETTGEL